MQVVKDKATQGQTTDQHKRRVSIPVDLGRLRERMANKELGFSDVSQKTKIRDYLLGHGLEGLYKEQASLLNKANELRSIDATKVLWGVPMQFKPIAELPEKVMYSLALNCMEAALLWSLDPIGHTGLNGEINAVRLMRYWVLGANKYHVEAKKLLTSYDTSSPAQKAARRFIKKEEPSIEDAYQEIDASRITLNFCGENSPLSYEEKTQRVHEVNRWILDMAADLLEGYAHGMMDPTL